MLYTQFQTPRQNPCIIATSRRIEQSVIFSSPIVNAPHSVAVVGLLSGHKQSNRVTRLRRPCLAAAVIAAPPSAMRHQIRYFVGQPGQRIFCRRLGQEGLSLVVVAVLLALGLQDLDELVEASGEGRAYMCDGYQRLISSICAWLLGR